MKNYAIENDFFKHPQRMLISSFNLENGSIITPLFNFYMELGLQCTLSLVCSKKNLAVRRCYVYAASTKIRSVPASVWDNYKFLQEIWQKHGMTTFKDFLQFSVLPFCTVCPSKMLQQVCSVGC